MAKPIRKTARLGEHVVTIETGKLAKQASGAVVVSVGDSMVLVTCVAKGHNPEARFFPMVVDYVEKSYANGTIPGGFLKREGRLSDQEVLNSRIIDRPIRPLFPDGFKGDTQITCTIISHDGENDTDTLALTGASAALMISPAPFAGPIAGVRVGRLNGKFIANPTVSEQAECDINIVMAASADAIVMVEGEADEVSEADMLSALDFGFEAVQELLEVQHELAAKVGKDKIEYIPEQRDPAVYKKVEEVATERLSEALRTKDKLERYAKLDALKAEIVTELADELPEQSDEIKECYAELKSALVRGWILDDSTRMDGRRLDEIRRIDTEVRLLPRVHGSSLFTRGETQGLVTVTLGTGRDSKLIDNLTGRREENFYLHYNFPPYSVGEIKMLRGPGRREIGHGFLAHKSLEKVMPSFEQFPYVVRVVSEVLESNGSSSMATVCGGSMALMDAGVPISAPVAGIAMGLIHDGERYAVLSDILGDEDHLGDMDFKVTGTANGITALQMDIKIKGLKREIMEAAMQQALDGRLHILQKMAESISRPNAELSEHAPRIHTIQIPVDRIRDVIGSGGKTIRSIQERTGCTVNVEDDGTVKIAATDGEKANECIEIIRALTASAVVGEIYLGTVAKVTDFGAFVTILPGVDGLCHISELSNDRVDKVEDIAQEGDELIVQCLGVESNGKVRLSRKEALGKAPTVVAHEIAL